MSYAGNLRAKSLFTQECALAVWQWLLEEGGYSNAKEVRAGVPKMAGSTPRELWKCLDMLTLNRCIVKKMTAGEHPRCGVTTACVRPRGHDSVMSEGGQS